MLRRCCRPTPSNYLRGYLLSHLRHASDKTEGTKLVKPTHPLRAVSTKYPNLLHLATDADVAAAAAVAAAEAKKRQQNSISAEASNEASSTSATPRTDQKEATESTVLPDHHSRPSTSTAFKATTSTSVVSVGLPVAVFVDNPAMEDPLCTGRVSSRIAANIFAVTFDQAVPVSPVIEVGSKVLVTKGDDPAQAGVVAKVHGNGTFSVLLDDDAFMAGVRRAEITVSEGRPKFMNSERYALVFKWIKLAGVSKTSDATSAATILFRRGWRHDTLYLLEESDVHCLSHLNKSVRMGILECADAERDRQRYLREAKKDRMKEQEWQYWLPKYSGTFGAVIGVFTACSIFGWNLKNWRRNQRPAQVEAAVQTLMQRIATAEDAHSHSHLQQAIDAFFWVLSFVHHSHSADDHAEEEKKEENADGDIYPVSTDTEPLSKGSRKYPIHRQREVDRLVTKLDQMNLDHPRILVLGGIPGSGKIALAQAAARHAGMPFLTVELRGKDCEDPVRAIVKALGVPNIDACGDLFEFVGEVCTIAKQKTNKAPAIFVKVHDPQRVGGSHHSLNTVYDDMISIGCERRVAHIVMATNSERSRHDILNKSRTDPYFVKEFTFSEALAYLGHKFEPEELKDLCETVGTSTNILDELVAARVAAESMFGPVPEIDASRGTDEKSGRFGKLFGKVKDETDAETDGAALAKAVEEGFSTFQFDAFSCYTFAQDKISYGVAKVKGYPVEIRDVLQAVAAEPYDRGLASSAPAPGELLGLAAAVDEGLVFYHAEKDAWMMSSRWLHTASYAALGQPASGAFNCFEY